MGFHILVVPGRAVVKRAALHRRRIGRAFPGDYDRDPGALVGVFDDGGRDQRKGRRQRDGGPARRRWPERHGDGMA
jgi:hypothetical protein